MTADRLLKHKRALIFFICIFVIIVALLLVFFINSIVSYTKPDIDYKDLIYRELTFKKYQEMRIGGANVCEVYFEEFAEPFEISTAQKKLDKKALEELEENERVQVYFCRSSRSDYEYSICEIKSDSTVFLSLSDYIKVSHDNDIAVMIFCPILIACSAFCIWVFTRMLKLANLGAGLGKIIIDFRIKENTIRVYNSFDTCSLVINDNVQDQYVGVTAFSFCLNGQLDIDGKIVPVQARLKGSKIWLYYDGQPVAKKFLVIG